MKLFILPADDSKDMEKISQELSLKKFKVAQNGSNFILMHKRRYGNVLIHAICLIIALFYISPILIINVAYFTYSYLWASPNVLITTERVDDEGNPLEFSNEEEILKKANAIL
ncbi:hypothetical protein [Methanobrevibacter sp.]|uniref:hypothetical protein n=1 Tax=Methanobrevibacter sp. TaxID=66852 RepID=UPI003D7E6861